VLIYWRKFPLPFASSLRWQWSPGEDYLAARHVTVEIIMRQAVLCAMQAEILDRAMQRVWSQRSVNALALELLRAHLGPQMNGEASAAAMLIERPGAHAGASQAQHYRSAIVTRRGEELALQTIEAHRAFAPCFARALGGKAPNRPRQLAHQRFIRARLERDDRVVLDPHRGAQLLGQEMPQVDRQAATELQTLRLERRRLGLHLHAAR